MTRTDVPAGRGGPRSWTVLGVVVAVLLTLLTTSTAAARGPLPADAASATAGAPATDTGLRHGWVTVDGGSLHYVRAGSGPAMVLLHGWPQTWWAWRDVLPALARDHTVLAFDLPGLGESAIPAAGYDKATTARRINQAVRRLGFTSAAVVGHDIGAHVAYAYARDFPAEVSRLTVVETPLPGFGLEEVFGRSWHFRFNMSAAPIPETVMDNDDVSTYLGMVFNSVYVQDAVDEPAFFRAYGSPARRTAGYEYYRAFPADAADNQAHAVDRRLTMPVAAMGGQYVFGAGVAASFRAVAADVREVIAPDAGHFVPEENPTFFVDCLRLFHGPAGVPAPRPELAACVA
ncbi:MAG TPA: alpha/beta hydrolase [Pseudonocardiaceae bacterium]